MVHHNLITVVLAHNHIPDIIKANISVYKEFASIIATDPFTIPFLHIKKVVLQDHSFSRLAFNSIINTFVQFVSQEQFVQNGYSLTNLICSTHWFQFEDDAAVATENMNNQEKETQHLFNMVHLE